MNFGSSFKDSPSAEQVADIYVRLSGKAPLLWEGKEIASSYIHEVSFIRDDCFKFIDQVNLPTVHSFEDGEATQTPLLVEVVGGGNT